MCHLSCPQPVHNMPRECPRATTDPGIGNGCSTTGTSSHATGTGQSRVAVIYAFAWQRVEEVECHLCHLPRARKLHHLSYQCVAEICQRPGQLRHPWPRYWRGTDTNTTGKSYRGIPRAACGRCQRPAAVLRRLSSTLDVFAVSPPGERHAKPISSAKLSDTTSELGVHAGGQLQRLS